MTEQTKVTAYAVGGRMHGKRLAGRGDTVRVPVPSPIEWMSADGPQTVSVPADVYTLWRLRVRGWTFRLPLWVHHSIPKTEEGMPLVARRDIPYTVGNLTMDGCPVRPAGWVDYQ